MEIYEKSQPHLQNNTNSLHLAQVTLLMVWQTQIFLIFDVATKGLALLEDSNSNIRPSYYVRRIKNNRESCSHLTLRLYFHQWRTTCRMWRHLTLSLLLSADLIYPSNLCFEHSDKMFDLKYVNTLELFNVSMNIIKYCTSESLSKT